MGLPIYVPKKQEVSNEANQPPLETNITEERRRRRSLPYDLVHQHIQRLHQLHHLHRTRDTASSTNSAGPVPLSALRSPVRLREEPRSSHRHRSHQERSQQSDGDTTSLSHSNDSTSNTIPNTSNALDEVIRRVNLLRQVAQQQERMLRPRYRSSRSLTSPTMGLSRDELLSRMNLPPITVDNPTLVPTQNLSRMAYLQPNTNPRHHHYHRHYTVALEPRSTNGNGFFESESPLAFGLIADGPIHAQQTRILSPIPRRYTVTGNTIEVDGDERDGYEVDGIGRGSASGECC